MGSSDLPAYASGFEVWTWYALFLAIVTIVALVGERVLPHLTAMWAATRMTILELRRERKR